MLIPPRGRVREQLVVCPGPVQVRVRCNGQMHDVWWDKGRIRFCAHTTSDLRFEVAMAPKQLSRCAQILEALRGPGMSGRYQGVPPALRRTLEEYRRHQTSYGHGRGTHQRDVLPSFRHDLRHEAIRRRFSPMLETLAGRGILMELGFPRGVNVPEAMATLRAPCGGGEPTQLGLFRGGTWRLDLPLILDLCCSPGASYRTGVCTDYTGCRVCQFTDQDLQAVFRHLETAQHRRAVLAALEAVFGREALQRFPYTLAEPHPR